MLCSYPSTSGINYVQALSPVAWYRYGVGITSSGGLVSQWDDQSGNDNHLIQASGTNQPSHESDGSILFDGVDNYLKTAGFTFEQPETIYSLCKQVTWTDGDTVFDGNAGNDLRLFQTNASPILRLFAGSSAADNTGLVLDTYGVVTAVFNGASSLIQINSNTPTTGDPGAANGSGFTLGAFGSGATAWSHIQVKEVLLYSAAHDADTRTRVIRYLAHVGGIAV